MSETQPTRSGKTRVRRDQFDRTSLRANGGQAHAVHRDYAAHFFRWGFAKRFIRRGMSVLDVGCGVDVPLVHVLCASLSHVPERYVGVELNRFKRARLNPAWATYETGIDFTSAAQARALRARHPAFDVACCFEMIEHMPRAEGRRLLRHLRLSLAPGGLALLSTPVFNGKAALNHVHEYTISELQREIQRAGFEIAGRFGTFADQRSLRKVASREELELVRRLSAYYDNDVIACFLAPLYPDAARNNVWLLKEAR